MQLDLFLPRFKLYDFADHGDMDITRMIFRVADVPYEEVLIDRNTEWEQLQQGLSGQTAADDSIVDMLADLLHEAHVSLKLWTKAMRSATNSEHDIDSLDKMAKHYVSTRLGPVLEKYLYRNGTGFLVGEKVTWADLMAISFFNAFFENGREDFLSAFPLIKQHYQRLAPVVLPQKKIDHNHDQNAHQTTLMA
ncbi:hypothetical protein Tcan_16407 [Toxocara canis]|uniref:GST C-terminal domain-containing protein n=1 Tax=Toxocara canis TaxID=6265 RepID=A0A0B2V7M3_TOXCA|nr:hypothetical protein Tcan_16407 [Toxocara canis]